MRTRWTYGPRLLAVFLGGSALPAWAGSFDLFGLDGQYQVQAAYSAAMRLHDPDRRIIDTAPAANIPLPDSMKLPESNNYDDGDRNFKKHSLVNNRLSLLGEIQLNYGDYGVLFRGDAFYDDVYHRRNDNTSPASDQPGATISKTELPTNKFSDDAEYYDGQRARLLDAYAYGSWYLTDETALNLRVGRHIAAWGESLFFAGIALAQSPADATKATVPGADVKSILLPVNQVSMQLSLDDKWTVLGQYKLEYKATELNPVGEFFSVADVVGPGAEFIYGIKNPLFLQNLSDIDLTSPELAEYVQLIGDLLLPNLPGGENLPVSPITGALGAILNNLDPLLPPVMLPDLNLIQPAGTPRYINVQRGPDKLPSDHGQYGVGVKYQVTPNSNVGLYHLRYHNTTPAPVQNYGSAELLPLPGGQSIGSAALGLQVPVTYNVNFFDGIHMSAMSFSTALFGANVGGELIYRDGVDVLVDVDGGLLGPVPTPVRAEVGQANVNVLYVLGPQYFWDALTVVADFGYNWVIDRDEGCGPTSCSDKLTYSKEAAAYSFLFIFDRKNLFNGWDLQVPLTHSKTVLGQSSLLSGFGSQMGEDDWRASIGFNFTYLQKITLGVSYSGYYGTPDFSANPYADRDNIGFTAKYNF
ncbi:DUF1302 domain-containing protein [Solimonas sp. K1W22B-7]|uniref:DUF1302 domain-containing protein n=1 Tax=Solimonas sp. K1W22B-7 TaxID=2303331 RepID=UPI0013C530B3|nr:DUF1302 family protein [Solimonas sp. K1W22B-7]